MLPPQAAAVIDPGAFVEVASGDVTVALRAGRFNRRTNTTLYDATVTNVSTDALTGPLILAIHDITSAAITVSGPDDTFPDGTPVFVLDSGDVAPGEARVTQVTFAGRARFSFDSTVFHQPFIPVTDLQLQVDPIPVPFNGDVVTVSGTAVEGAVIHVAGGTGPASGPVVDTGGSKANFQFSVAVPLAALQPMVDLTVTAQDEAGNVSPGVVVTVTRDFLAPAAPMLVTQGHITSSLTQTVCGLAEPGSLVRIEGGISPVFVQADSTFGLFSLIVNLEPSADNLLQVTATDAVGNVSPPADLLITQDPGAPSLGVNLVRGDLQFGFVGQQLMRPISARVLDDATGQPVSGVDLRFEVFAGGGSLTAGGVNAPSLLLTTDGAGGSEAEWTLGNDPVLGGGPDDEQLVMVDFAGNAGTPVIFLATGRAVPDPSDPTTFEGNVLTDGLIGVQGATISLGGISTVTAADGSFTLNDVPAGHQHLNVDASNALPLDTTYASIAYDVDVLEGQVNSLGRPAFIPIVDTANGVVIATGGPAVATQIRTSTFPGMVMTVLPNSVTCPDGQTECLVSLNGIPPDRLPMPLLNNGISGVILTIQPTGVEFSPPAPISFPNVDGLPPGSQVILQSFDHDVGDFVEIGPGTVNSDGSSIDSDPGVGIIKGAWHAAVPARRIPATLLVGKIANADLYNCDCWSNGARGTRAVRNGEVRIPNVPVGRVGIVETVDGVTALKATCFCKCKDKMTIPIKAHIVISDSSEDRNANGVLDAGEDTNANSVLNKAGRGSQVTVAQATRFMNGASAILQQCCVGFSVQTVQVLSRPQAEARRYAGSDAVLNVLVNRQKTAKNMNLYFVQELTGSTVGYQAGGSASPGVLPTGVIVEDITAGASVPQVIAHEGGHFQKLSHRAGDMPNVMFPFTSGGTKFIKTQCDTIRSLTTDANKGGKGNRINGAVFESEN